jgi:serine/threonine protein kinase
MSGQEIDRADSCLPPAILPQCPLHPDTGIHIVACSISGGSVGLFRDAAGVMERDCEVDHRCGMVKMHLAGILQRDVKPSNILMDESRDPTSSCARCSPRGWMKHKTTELQGTIQVRAIERRIKSHPLVSSNKGQTSIESSI